MPRLCKCGCRESLDGRRKNCEYAHPSCRRRACERRARKRRRERERRARAGTDPDRFWAGHRGLHRPSWPQRPAVTGPAF